MRVIMVLLVMRWASSLRLGSFARTLTFLKSTSENGPSTPAPLNKNFRDDFRGTRIFVQNLPPLCDWKKLKDHFKSAGTVVYASVSCDAVTKVSKGHGIVQYETTNEALKAIATLNNVMLGGSHLQLRPDMQERNNREKTVVKSTHWSTQPPRSERSVSLNAAVRPGDRPREDTLKKRDQKKIEIKATTIGPPTVTDDVVPFKPKSSAAPVVSKEVTHRRNQILNLLDNEPEVDGESDDEVATETAVGSGVAASDSVTQSTGQHEFVRIKKNAAIKYAKQASGLWTHDTTSIPESVSEEEVALIQSIVMERESFRASKQFERADEIRMALRRERRVQLNDAMMQWRVLPEKLAPL